MNIEISKQSNAYKSAFVWYFILGNRRIQRWLPNANSGDTISTGSSVEAQQILLDENNNLIILETNYNRLRLYSIATC